jgi:hypothetical protein
VGGCAVRRRARAAPDRGVSAGERLGEPAWRPFCASGACVAPEAGRAIASGGSGDHIVLGLSEYGLESTAAKVGGRTLMNDPNFRETFINAVANPDARFTISLEGLRGATIQEQLNLAVQQGLARGPDAGFTNWSSLCSVERGALVEQL